MIFHRPEILILNSFFPNLARRAAICIVQIHICDCKLSGLQTAVLKLFLVFFGQNDRLLAFFSKRMIFQRPEFLIPKRFFPNLARRAAICIAQFHICDFKLWGLQNAVFKSFLVFLGQNDRFLPFFGNKK